MSKRILVVDDSASMRQIVGYTLRGAGYEVVEAVDGKDAMTKLPSGPYQMVVTDLNMPNLDGIGLIREIRASMSHKFVPVIILTTETQEERRQEGKAAGATGWIQKPFRSDQLVTVARKVLGG